MNSLEQHIQHALEHSDTAFLDSSAPTCPKDLRYSLLLRYAAQRDELKCACILNHLFQAQTYDVPFWHALIEKDPDTLAWMGQHDSIAMHFQILLPIINDEWCIAEKVDIANPGPAYRLWWAQYPEAWQNAVQDHLRVSWQNKMLDDVVLYHLLENPTKEQAVFAATHQYSIWDQPTLSKYFPDLDQTMFLYQDIYEPSEYKIKIRQFLLDSEANLTVLSLPETYELS